MRPKAMTNRNEIECGGEPVRVPRVSAVDRAMKCVGQQPTIATLLAIIVLLGTLTIGWDGPQLVSGSDDKTVNIGDTIPHSESRNLLHGCSPNPERPKLPATSAWHGRDYIPAKRYVCYRPKGRITIDGKLDEDSWKAVPWTDAFVDIQGDRKPKPRFRTRAKMLWDDKYFYVAAQLEEPHVWGTLKKHDSIIYHDNDFEVFIDPNGDSYNYAEYEINVLGTGFDLRMPKPYKNSGRADIPWAIPGLKSAVHIDGTLNDPTDIDRRWSVELAFPWEPLDKLDDNNAPPRHGDQWRVNFSRVQWRHRIVDGKYEKIPKKKSPEDNWVWSPQFAINMHRPETWGYVQFSTAAIGAAAFRPDPTERARYLLHQVHYAQRQFQLEHKRWAKNLAELGLKDLSHASLARPITINVVDDSFTATTGVKLADGKVVSLKIRHDARILSR